MVQINYSEFFNDALVDNLLDEMAGADDEITPEEQVRRIVEKARGEAAEITRAARADAEEALTKTQQDIDLMTREANFQLEENRRRVLEENRVKGYQEGYSKAEAAGEAIKAEAQSVLDAAYREQEEVRQALEPDAVHLIIGITDKLLGDAVDVNPGVVTALIRAGFAGATLSTKGEVTVRVSAQDYEEVAAHKDEIMAMVGGSAELSIVQDISLNATDCLIDTPYGRIDCSLAPQYKALRENLVYLLSQKNQEQPL